MKKVALIITRMIPGGASKVVQQIIEAASGKYDLTLICGPEDLDKKIIKYLSDKCNLIIIPSLVRNISLLKDYKAYKEILCELRKNKYDVVHTHTSKAGFIGRKAAIKAEVPVIIHSPHGSIYTEDSNIAGVPSLSLGKKMLQLAEKSVGEKTTWLTTLSEHEKKICLDLSLSKENNTIVIHNGIDIEKFSVTEEEKNQVRKAFGISENDIVLLSVGRLSSEKGHAILIDTYSKLEKQKKAEKNLKLIIVGDGLEKENLEKQAENLNLSVLNIQSDNISRASSIPFGCRTGAGKQHQAAEIIFTGHRDDVRKYLAMSDIFVLPSLYEGFGIAVIEAMAAGLPVVATAVGGVPEIISDEVTGFLVPPFDTENLLEKVGGLINKPNKRKEIGKAGKENVKDFKTEKMIKKYFNLYG